MSTRREQELLDAQRKNWETGRLAIFASSTVQPAGPGPQSVEEWRATLITAMGLVEKASRPKLRLIQGGAS